MSGDTTAVPREMLDYWNAGFLAAEARPGAFYDLNALPPVTRASHFRRMALLDALPLGDLSDKTCVDYGVGSWGFACVFPRLQHCREAVGIDLSPEAVRMSEEVSRRGSFPYGKRVRYFTSTGSRIALDDESVDVFFAGEAIEHVFNVDAFLGEVYRVLRPDGVFILTTPNANACLYRAHGERYCHNAEHVSLMSYREVRDLVDGRFVVTIAKGFNGSFYRTLDASAVDQAFAERWSAEFEDTPSEATGVILQAAKRPGLAVTQVQEQFIHHSSPAVEFTGAWSRCALHGPLTGARAGEPGSRMHLAWQGDGLVLFLWSDPWCGRVHLDVDGRRTTVDAFSPVGGFLQRRWLGLAPGPHEFALEPAGAGRSGGTGTQAIVWGAIGMSRSPHR